HPGYLGSILQAVGMPLVVNAYASLPLAVVLIGLFVRRLRWEEEFLAAHLPGYAEYARRTSRLIPGVW
ncbi:MAG: methyltransferase family protein, partial [Chloroflexota bacterium]